MTEHDEVAPPPPAIPPVVAPATPDDEVEQEAGAFGGPLDDGLD